MAERIRVSKKTIDRYRESLSIAHAKFDAEAKPIIEKMRNYMKGNQWPAFSDRDPKIMRMVVNLIFSDIKVMLPVLALRNPRVFVKPVGATVRMPTPPTMPGAPPSPGPPVQIINGKPVPVLEASKAKEALINWRWRELKLNQQLRRCIVDALTAPFGVMKIGYTMAVEKVDPPSLEEAMEGEEGELLEVNQLIKAESPFAVRWSPLDFRVDPEARYPDLSDAAWIAFRWVARLDDVKRNPRFKNTRDLKPNVQVRRRYDQSGPNKDSWISRGVEMDVAESVYERVELWEVWDKRDHVRLVIVEDYDKALEFRDWPLAHDNFPAETLCLTEYPDTLYGPPDLYQVLTQQDAYNEVASMIHNHVKRYVRKYIAQRGAFDEKEMDKLLLPYDGLIVETDATVRDAIAPLQDAPIPVDWWQTRLHFRDDHDRVSGVADFIRGVAEKVDTATEASFIQSNLNVRTNDMRSIVEGFAVRISKQLLTVDAQTLDVPRAVPILGPDGALAFGQFVNVADRSLLMADVDVEVEIGSMQPINQQIRKQDILQIYGMLRNNPLVDQFELHKRLASAFTETIPDLDRVLIPKSQFQQVAEVLQAQMGGGAPGGAPAPPGPGPGPASPAGPRPGAPRRPVGRPNPLRPVGPRPPGPRPPATPFPDRAEP